MKNNSYLDFYIELYEDLGGDRFSPIYWTDGLSITPEGEVIDY